jgi:hypothetical protein
MPNTCEKGMKDMSDQKEVYQLTLTPGGADTLITTQSEFDALVKEAFEEEGQSNLLTDGSVTIRPQRPFPGVEVITILIWFGQQIALEIFKRKVLPKLEARFEAWWTKKQDDTPPSDKDTGDPA